MAISGRAHVIGGEDWTTRLVFSEMTWSASHEIADTWKYPPPFDFYDATADPDDYHEFVTPELWPEVFQQVRYCGDLLGFVAAQAVQGGSAYELSLGMHPALTGRGWGVNFVDAGMAWLDSHGYQSRVMLSVAALNTRAIKVYQGAGFIKVREFAQETNGGTYDFVEMEHP